VFSFRAPSGSFAPSTLPCKGMSTRSFGAIRAPGLEPAKRHMHAHSRGAHHQAGRPKHFPVVHDDPRKRRSRWQKQAGPPSGSAPSREPLSSGRNAPDGVHQKNQRDIEAVTETNEPRLFVTGVSIVNTPWSSAGLLPQSHCLSVKTREPMIMLLAYSRWSSKNQPLIHDLTNDLVACRRAGRGPWRQCSGGLLLRWGSSPCIMTGRPLLLLSEVVRSSRQNSRASSSVSAR